MIENYPDDIRAWINARGGWWEIPWDGYWTLKAPLLWAMNYRKCQH
jgi:hypothetical protein